MLQCNKRTHGRRTRDRTKHRHVPPRDRGTQRRAPRALRATAPRVRRQDGGDHRDPTRWYAPEDVGDLGPRGARGAPGARAAPASRPRTSTSIIVGTDSPDYITPATSVVVQHKLGATQRRHVRRRLRVRVVPDRARRGGRPHGDESVDEERPRRSAPT